MEGSAVEEIGIALDKQTTLAHKANMDNLEVRRQELELKRKETQEAQEERSLKRQREEVLANIEERKAKVEEQKADIERRRVEIEEKRAEQSTHAADHELQMKWFRTFVETGIDVEKALELARKEVAKSKTN